MGNELRHRRLRQLVSKVNKERKKQAKKIDILCNDFVAMQRSFIKNLETITFTADFYESVMGVTDLNSLFDIAGTFIKDRTADAEVAFFLRQEESFDLHMPESDQPITLDDQRLEKCFNAELVNDVCNANKICTLTNLLEMGLQGSPSWLNKISATTIPMGQFGNSVGFILIYQLSKNPLTAAQLSHVSSITLGLSRAIQSCRLVSQISG